MPGKTNVALRVLGIVCLSGLIVAASLLFLLLAACGLLTDLKGSERWISLAIVAVYGVILVGGFFGIFKLAKGMMGTPALQGSEPAAPPASAPPPATPAENRKLLEPLRLAMAASVGLSFLAIVAFRFQAQGEGGPMPLVMLPFFVLYQIPYLVVFWLTRDGPERKGVGLALTFCAMSVLYSALSWGPAILLHWMNVRKEPGALISLADVVATAAAAFFAFQLWRRGAQTKDDVLILVGGGLGSIIYLAVVQGVQTFVLLRGLGG